MIRDVGSEGSGVMGSGARSGSDRPAGGNRSRRLGRPDGLGRAISWLGLVLLLGVACAKPRSVEPSMAVAATLRHPPAGAVVGTKGLHGGYVWRGIPYAVPPVGGNRFRAPRPLAAWAGVLEALEFAPPCPQYASSVERAPGVRVGDLIGSEDCLYLNVYAPEEARVAAESAGASPSSRASGLPVMFWIHGGGNTSGSSSFYDGSRLASEEGVIVVTLDYRLGFLGWFRHHALRHDADPVEASGNFGTLDLIRGLDWVRENIAAFGGDPDNVTIFGESAGGWNVISLLASPLAAGRFHRAIAQSALTWSDSPSRAENRVDDPEPGDPSSSSEALIRLMLADGLAADRAGAVALFDSMEDTDLARYLRGKSLEEFFGAYRAEGDEADDGYSCPRIFEDGVVLPAVPLAHAFRPGAGFNRVPVILGTNKDEEKLFLLYDREYTSRLFGVIPRMRDRARYLRDAQTITRIWRMMAVDEVATDLAREMPGKVFAYRFDWDEEPSLFGIDLAELIGAAHGFEIPFVFGHWNLGPDSHRLFDAANLEGREVLSAAMRAYWAEFARTGEPGRGTRGRLPEWLPWMVEAERFVVLDTEAGGGLRMASGSESAREIARSILSDPGYSNRRERCRALAAIHDWAPLSFSAQDYAEMGEGHCHDFPLRSF